MSTAIAVIEQTSPLAARPLQQLPQWVIDLKLRMGKTTVGDVVTTYLYPQLTQEQRAAIESSRANLIRQLDLTPDRHPDLNDKVLDAIGELMLAKPYRASDGALRREASVRSFQYALDDIPAWATLRAIRNWHKGEVASYLDAKDKFNCRWMPDPTELRDIARRYTRDVEERVEMFDNILCAVDPSERLPRGRLLPPKRTTRDDDVGFKQIFDGYVVPEPATNNSIEHA
jgi:hypothetical protein